MKQSMQFTRLITHPAMVGSAPNAPRIFWRCWSFFIDLLHNFDGFEVKISTNKKTLLGSYNLSALSQSKCFSQSRVVGSENVRALALGMLVTIAGPPAVRETWFQKTVLPQAQLLRKPGWLFQHKYNKKQCFLAHEGRRFFLEIRLLIMWDLMYFLQTLMKLGYFNTEISQKLNLYFIIICCFLTHW